MATFHVTVQDARVIERTYEVEAADADAAHDAFYETHDSDMPVVRERTVSSNWEIVDVKPVGKN